MPPPLLRPFPFPDLSIGTDIAHIPRITRLVSSPRTLPRFLRKVLTAREEREFHARFPRSVAERKLDTAIRRDCVEEQRWVETASRFLAGRWAAKEAVVKAWGGRRLMLRDVEVLRNGGEGGRGVVGVVLDEGVVRAWESERKRKRVDSVSVLHGDVEEIVEEEPAGQVVKISISHDGEYATAVCLAAVEERVG